MAKLSVIARQIKREKLVATHAAKRKALKEAGDYLPWINFLVMLHR